jgi:2-isopropylmalate synthase
MGPASRWTTVGVPPNIIDASFRARMDSVIYKLVKSGAPASAGLIVERP